MAGGFKIETPKGAVFTTTGKNGKIIARLEWNKNFSAERSDQFNQTQRFVDSEVLRLSSPYVPFQTGMLDKSGILGTDVGSGEVNYIAPTPPLSITGLRSAVPMTHREARSGSNA